MVGILTARMEGTLADHVGATLGKITEEMGQKILDQQPLMSRGPPLEDDSCEPARKKCKRRQ
jgi:hypothetical protein